uniref:Uncharacterized protein n=1 Tax=Plectus sambesii TaxID=2011161 RepID=A0A914W7S3_9BILA
MPDCSWNATDLGNYTKRLVANLEVDDLIALLSKHFLSGKRNETGRTDQEAVLYVTVVLVVYALIIMLMFASDLHLQSGRDGNISEFYDHFITNRDHWRYVTAVKEQKQRYTVQEHLQRIERQRMSLPDIRPHPVSTRRHTLNNLNDNALSPIREV